MSATTPTDNRNIFFIADVGTTTIKASLCVAPSAALVLAAGRQMPEDKALSADKACTALLATRSEKNAQSVYGLDVISRVLYAHHNGVAPLQKKVLSQLLDMLSALCNDAGVQKDTLSGLIITGNTVMLHLVRGFSVQGFEMAPFTPVSVDAAEVPFGMLFESVLAISADGGRFPSNETTVFFPPCIDAFIGSDAVCAVLSALTGCAAARDSASEKTEPGVSPQYPLLLADVGTNTEIVLIKKSSALSEDCTAGCAAECTEAFAAECIMPEKFTITCCSTAAGPAFEGGVLGGRYTGSELIHLLSKLLESGTMDETGLLDETAERVCACESENAESSLLEKSSAHPVTQDAIRQLQLAKGAVCAAIETLLQEEELSAEEVGSFVLCGNFGSALSAEEAERIGLFPAGLAAVALYAGNAAEQGARLLYSDEMKALAKKIAASGKLVQLADSRFFARRYIERMNFTL